MKAKKQKLLFKPTPISRLSKMSVPFKMVGDPTWRWQASGKVAWESRCKAVYGYEMERKDWPMAWKPETWVQAHKDNERLNHLIAAKWGDYEVAWEDNCIFDHDEACRDNAAWDYHHEYTPELETA